MSGVLSIDQNQISQFEPNAGNSRLLRDAFGGFATGVTIVTANADKGPVAITANSFSSVSMDPPLVLWSVDRKSRRAPHFLKAETFAIHVLDAQQEELCWRIAKDMNGLRESDYDLNDQNVPILKNCLVRFECSQHAIHRGGDHEVILGEVKSVAMQSNGEALGFFKGQIGQFLKREAS